MGGESGSHNFDLDNTTVPLYLVNMDGLLSSLDRHAVKTSSELGLEVRTTGPKPQGGRWDYAGTMDVQQYLLVYRETDQGVPACLDALFTWSQDPQQSIAYSSSLAER